MKTIKELFFRQSRPSSNNTQRGVVTIITPVFNAAKHLKDCVESIISQDYKSWNLVIIDDGSTDGSVDIAKEYSKNNENITLVQALGSRNGPAKIRNIAINRTVSEYIAFLDADDLMSTNSLKCRVRILDEDSMAAAAYSPVKLVGENGEDLGLNGTRKGIVNFTDLAGNLFITSCIMVRTSIISQLKGFDPKFRHGEDWDLWLRMTRMGNYIKCAPDSHIDYRQHPTSISHSAIHKDFVFRKNVSKIAWSADKRCPNPLPEFAEGLATGIRAMGETQRAFSTYIACLFSGDHNEARKMLKEVNPKLLVLSDPKTLAESSILPILRNAAIPKSGWDSIKESNRRDTIEKASAELPPSLSKFKDAYFSFLFS
jgi:teichuronic acid biosynthesis glycosyltransferase TuaG